LSRKGKFRANLPAEFGKYNVDATDVGVQAIHARRKRAVGNQTTEPAVSPAPQVMAANHHIQLKMKGPGSVGNAGASDPAEIQVLDALAINMDLILSRESRKRLDSRLSLCRDVCPGKAKPQPCGGSAALEGCSREHALRPNAA